VKLSTLMVLVAVSGSVDEPAPTCEQRFAALQSNAVHLTTAAFIYSYNCGLEKVPLDKCQENFFKRMHPNP